MSLRKFAAILSAYYFCGFIAYGTMYSEAIALGHSPIEAKQAGAVVCAMGPLGLALSVLKSGFWSSGWRLK